MLDAQRMRNILYYATEAHKTATAQNRVRESAEEAARWITAAESESYNPAFAYRKAMECLETAEAWLAYLQDPTIIDNLPERNLPA
jgi:hypothetical protein